MVAGFTHFDEQGASRMVDVSDKPETLRTATAAGRVRMMPATLAAILDQRLAKGDVREVARLAGILAAKKTGDLIPLCHPIGLDGVSVDLSPDGADALRIVATARVTGRTGVEMEALTAVAVAALTVYDMCKSMDRSMTIEDVMLVEKTGGRSGTYRRGDGGDGGGPARSGAER
jgi:cyclic pyranopterin phosphate synthase